MLADNKLRYHILPKGEPMNRWYYSWLIANRFPQWKGACKYIVQDFEKCLRCEEPLQEMAKVGMSLVEGHPKYSQDLNAIENAWKLLRDRMAETLPSHLERRDDSTWDKNASPRAGGRFPQKKIVVSTTPSVKHHRNYYSH